MALLIVIASAEPGGEESKLAGEMVGHLSRAWPGCFLMCASQAPFPLDASPDRIDWLGLPSDTDAWGPLGLGARLLASVCERLDIDAVIGVGCRSVELLDQLAEVPRLALTWSGPQGETTDGGVSIAAADRIRGSGYDWLEEWILGHAPLEILAGSEGGLELDLDQLRRHPALAAARRVVLRWRGRPNRQLSQVLDVLVEATSADITLQVLSSEYFDVPRAGLTHSPADFLLRPAAWKQVAGFFWFVASMPGGVGLQVRTLSRRGWIRGTVRASNLAINSLRTIAWPLTPGRRR